MKVVCALCAASLSLACHAAPVTIAGPGYTAVDQDHAMLELIDGKASAALVSGTLYDAVMGARDAAWSKSHRMLVVPATLQRHALGDSGKALVTVGDPDAIAKAEIAKPR